MTSFEFKFEKGNTKPLGKVFKKKLEKGTTEGKKKNIKIQNYDKNNLKDVTGSTNGVKTKITEKKLGFIKRKSKKDKNVPQDDKGDSDQLNKTNIQHSLFSEKYKNLYVNTNIKGKSVIEKVFSAGNKFSSLNIHRHILSNLEKHNFKVLTNVQEKAIPVVLEGQNVLVRSQTGSGKTLVYSVPLLNSLVNNTTKLQRNDGVKAIIIVPTRELVLQIVDLFKKINTFQWIVVGHLCGGENRKTEKDRLRKGVHILIATPGRLLDHILHTSALNIKKVDYLVLDEADRLLDMGFKKDIVRLVEELDNQHKFSSYDPLALLRGQKSEKKESNEELTLAKDDTEVHSRQCILLSATLSKEIAELADFTMKSHTYIDALDETERTNPNHMIIPDTVKQEFLVTFVKHRLVLLSAMIVSFSNQKDCKVFVFMATSQMVDFHYELFRKYLLKMPINKGKMKFGDVVLLDDVELDDSEDEQDVLDVELFKLHGSMDQNVRKEVFKGFKKSKKGILLCTDVAARGLDVPEADCIIQYNGPQTEDDYLHRVGRTGRAGKTGSAVIFLTHEEQEFVSRLQGRKVFLKERKSDVIIKNLSIFMEEPDKDKAVLSLQRRYETALSRNKELHRKACFGYSSWARFYSSYPNKLKPVFDFKKANLGHYVTSFGLKETPTSVARVVKGQVSRTEPKKLNKKLANHQDNVELKRPAQKRPIKSLSLTTSEFSSGLEPSKKKRKKNKDFSDR
ncbi:probable ATP-dependent RNA helicase CG8611 [Sitophilus oryzae]|uniref:RNA helicase n=1 Tax=Sitophilus oryzae TaxID=7048 RepID=A0A6J2XVQ0_SITOR|nr:probable ATP-dependent RNA helicase CG8611 [Sitophilus oryzae]